MEAYVLFRKGSEHDQARLPRRAGTDLPRSSAVKNKERDANFLRAVTISDGVS
jgi:hypothetical protein